MDRPGPEPFFEAGFVDRLRRGEEAAWNQLVALLRPVLVRFAQGNPLLRNDVEGLVGEIWLRAYRRRTDLPDDPRPWIRGIACNIRRERMRLRPTVPLDPSLAAPEDGRDAATADAVNRAIDELPEPHRTLLIWAREGRPRRVMARDLGISQPTLRRRLARAFKALRRKLGHETDERGRRSPDET